MQNFTHSFGKKLKRTLMFFDLYGQTANFYFKKQPKFQSASSGLMSMGVIALVIYSFIGYINSWVQKEKMTLITSAISYSATEVLTKNLTFDYNVNSQTYYIYWALTANLPNGTILHAPQLKPYFSYKVSYISQYYVNEELATEPCHSDRMDRFIGLDEATIKSDINKTNINRICIKDNFRLGIYPNLKNLFVNQSQFQFSVYLCSNSTSNNNSCASQEAIDDMIKYSYVQTSTPTTVFDFNNVKKPQKTYYDYRFTYFDKSMNKFYKNQLTATFLYTDHGIISEDFQLEATNFNPNLDYDPNLRQKPEDPLFQINFQMGANLQFYYLRNLKLNELIGNLGGLVNAFVLIGKIFCVTYNLLSLKIEIINTTFANSNSNCQSSPNSLPRRKSSITNSIARSFSYLGYFFPSKETRKFYQKGSQYLHEYLDIRKIIKRLQDLDKIKMILLNEDQQRLFERIPKPDVLNPKSKLFLENMNKYKYKKTKTTTISRKPSTNNILKSNEDEYNDPISKKISLYIDPEINLNKFETSKDQREGKFLIK